MLKSENNTFRICFVFTIYRIFVTNKQTKTNIMKNLTDEKKIKILTIEANYWTSVLNECTKEDVYFLAEKMGINTIHPTSKRKVNTNNLISIIKYNKAAEMRDFLRNK